MRPVNYNLDEIPLYGLALNIVSRNGSLKLFKTVETKNSKLLFTQEGEQFEQIAALSTNKEARDFLREHVIILNKELEDEVEDINMDNLAISYFTPRLIS